MRTVTLETIDELIDRICDRMKELSKQRQRNTSTVQNSILKFHIDNYQAKLDILMQVRDLTDPDLSDENRKRIMQRGP
jgi:hypothetical protein